MPESFNLESGPAYRFDVGGCLPVKIAIGDLDPPILAEFQLPDALGERYLPVADHKDGEFFNRIASICENPNRLLDLELV
jgi:hypothetical protein